MCDKPILTKKGKPVSERTFGQLTAKDKTCKHLAVDLEFCESLSLFGRYVHLCGYPTINWVERFLRQATKSNKDPFVIVNPREKKSKVVSLARWKAKRGIKS